MKPVLRTAFFACLAGWQLRGLFPSGLIYRQDWAWPVTTRQLLDARFQNGVPWNMSGLGGAAIAPLEHPLFYIWSALGLVFGAHWTLVATLVLTFALFGAGIASTARRLWDVTVPTSLIVGALAQLGAPMLNKLVAGHIYYLVALTAFLWMIRCLVGGSRRPTAAFLLAGVLVGFAIIQIQIYAIALVALLIAAIATTRAPSWARWMSVLIAASQLFPELFAALGRDAPATYNMFAPRLLWELNNSSPFPSALFLMGYSPRYAERVLNLSGSYGFVVFALEIGIGLGIVALLVRRRVPAAYALFSGWILGTALVLGFYGPLSPILDFAFAHFRWMAVFRELYHFAAPAWICEVLLLAAIAGVARWRFAVTCYFLVTAALLATLWLPKNFGGMLVPFPKPASLTRQLDFIANSPGDARFLLWPAEWPVGPRDGSGLGNDPASYPIGRHPDANQFRLSGPLEVAAALIREGKPRRAAPWLSAAGVQWMITEPWLREYLLQRAPPLPYDPPWLKLLIDGATRPRSSLPSLPPTCLLCAYHSVAIVNWPYKWRSGDVYIRSNALQHPSGNCAPPLTFNRMGAAHGGWGNLANWSWLDARLAMFGNGFITWGPRPMPIDACFKNRKVLRVLLMSGTLLVDGHERRIPKGQPVLLPLSRRSQSIGVHNGVLAVGKASVYPSHTTSLIPRERTPLGEQSLHFNWRSGIGEGHINTGTRWIVLKTPYSRDWELTLSSGMVLRHVEASGYANAWMVRVRRPSRVVVWYSRWAPTAALSKGALFLWLLGAGCAIFFWWRPEAVRVIAK